MAPAGEAHVSPTMKYMNTDPPNNQKLDALYSDLDAIVQKSEALIAEFMRLTREVPRRPYSLLGFFRKNRNADAYGNFRRVDDKLGDVVAAIDRFRTTNIRYLPASTRVYIAAYEEYLQSVKAAAELRVAFEREFRGLHMWTCSAEEVDHMRKLSVMIGPSLEACERNAHKVNVVIKSFERQEKVVGSSKNKG